MSIYKCPKCNQPLTRVDKSYKCFSNHSYDISKKGYVNLMLANQGHSLNEGDSKEMIDARKRFLECEFYICLRNTLYDAIFHSLHTSNNIFLDVACGDGYYTNYLHQELSKKIKIKTYGVDISKAAINSASSSKNIKKLENISYCVGNMDYLPFLDSSIDIVLNCFAPINEKEFYRVMKTNGYYIRVLPGKNHLLQLKEFLYKEVHLNEPKENKIDGFSLENEYQVDDVININNQQIQDLFTMTPYYYKTSFEAKERLKKLEALTTQISFIIKVYKKI